MTSLKGYTVGLARLLRTTPATLYERQRALVRAGLLDLGEGRGPGSGVRTTGQSVALLLISMLATESLTESATRTEALATARPRKGKRCPYTGMKSFRDAFAAILVATGKAAGVMEITVSRTADLAQIKIWTHDGSMAVIEFVGAASTEPGIKVTTTLSHDLLQQIASDVQALVIETFEPSRSSQ